MIQSKSRSAECGLVLKYKKRKNIKNVSDGLSWVAYMIRFMYLPVLQNHAPCIRKTAVFCFCYCFGFLCVLYFSLLTRFILSIVVPSKIHSQNLYILNRLGVSLVTNSLIHSLHSTHLLWFCVYFSCLSLSQ